MKDIALNDCGDISIPSQDINQKSELEELAQRVKIILSVRQGEFELEDDLGINFDEITGKNLDFEYLKEYLITEITSQEQSVVAVKDMEIKLENRHLSVSMRLIADFGEIETEVVLNA